MPVIINGYNLPVMPAGYSSEFLERECVFLTNGRTNTDLTVRFYKDKANAFACVVNANTNSEGRHDVIAKMEFNQERDDLISVSRVFENEEYQHVELVATARTHQGSNIAIALGELLKH